MCCPEHTPDESESHSVVSDSLQPHGLYSLWNSLGQNTSLPLLQGIFPTQGLNPGLPHCRWILYQLSHKGSPRTLERVVVVQSLSHVRLFAIPWTVVLQAPLSMRFSRQEYWSGLPCPSPGDLPNPGIEPGSPALQANSLLIQSKEEMIDKKVCLVSTERRVLCHNDALISFNYSILAKFSFCIRETSFCLNYGCL